MTTSLDCKQDDGCLGIDSEGSEHHFVQDVLFHPAQLPGQVPCRDKAAEGAPLPAGHDELEASTEALLQVL